MSTHTSDKPHHEATVILITATLSSFLGPFMISATTIALPDIERHFATDALSLSWVVGAYMLAYAVFLIPFGRLSDIFGRKRIFLSGAGVFTAGAIASALSSDIRFLLVARFLQGAGSALIATSSLAILSTVFPAARRGRVFGINTAATYLGISAGPFFGGMLVHQWGWRSVFWFVVPTGCIVMLLLLIMVRDEWRPARGSRFDTAGSLIYAVALSAIMTGSTILPATAALWFFACGALLLTLFALRQLRIPHPVFDLRLFRGNRIFAFSNASALINYSATASIAFLLSLYLQKIKGLDARAAGMILFIQPLIMAILSPLAGRLSERIEPRYLSSLGMAICAAGLGMLAVSGAATPVTWITTCLVVLGAGFALFSSPNMNSIMSSVDSRHYSTASASVGTMRLLGNILSMSASIIVFSMLIGRTGITPEKYPALILSMRIIFSISAACSALGIFFSFARGNLHRRRG